MLPMNIKIAMAMNTVVEYSCKRSKTVPKSLVFGRHSFSRVSVDRNVLVERKENGYSSNRGRFDMVKEEETRRG